MTCYSDLALLDLLMILGIGLDILCLSRLTALVERRGVARLARRVLTDNELSLLGAEQVLVDNKPAAVLRFLAVRWTAKEAAFKALSSRRTISWKDVEVLKRPESGGRPLLAMSNRDSAVKDDILLHLSVSHDGDYVASTVLAEVVPAQARQAPR